MSVIVQSALRCWGMPFGSVRNCVTIQTLVIGRMALASAISSAPLLHRSSFAALVMSAGSTSTILAPLRRSRSLMALRASHRAMASAIRAWERVEALYSRRGRLHSRIGQVKRIANG